MNRRIFVVIVAVIAGLAIGFIGIGYFRGMGDGIETNKVYALAYTYKAVIKGGGEARVFDFADRSLPRTSIVVPLADDRGMPLVRHNTNLPPSSIRKVVASVPTRTVEGVTYPGYNYVEWQYHLGTVGPQSVVPTVTPRK